MNISAGHNKRQQQARATQKPASGSRLMFTAREREAFLALRTRYQQSHDLLDERELAHLRFFRWLCQTGRIAAETPITRRIFPDVVAPPIGSQEMAFQAGVMSGQR